MKDTDGNLLFQKLERTQGLKVCENANDLCFGIHDGKLSDDAMQAYYIPYKAPGNPWDWESKTAILVHGLSDSPFYMKEIAESLHNKGYNILSVLLSGHGNPSDEGPMELVNVEYKDWQDNLIDTVLFSLWVSDSIDMIGFSTGSAVITNFLVKHNVKKINKSVLISPAIELISSSMLQLGSFLYGKDHIVSEPKDFGKGARYLYFPLNAPNQLRLLNKETKSLMKKYKINTPILSVFAASEDTFDISKVNSRLRKNARNYTSVLLGNPRAEILNPRNSLYNDEDLKEDQVEGIELSIKQKEIDAHLLKKQYVEHSSPLSDNGSFRGKYEFIKNHELVLDLIHDFIRRK